MKKGDVTIIEFKAKPDTFCVHNSDKHELSGWHISENAVKIPALKKRHVVQYDDRVDGFINSDMLDGILARQLRDTFGRQYSHIDLDDLPEGVTVSGGFMKTVRIEIADKFR